MCLAVVHVRCRKYAGGGALLLISGWGVWAPWPPSQPQARTGFSGWLAQVIAFDADFEITAIPHGWRCGHTEVHLGGAIASAADRHTAEAICENQRPRRCATYTRRRDCFFFTSALAPPICMAAEPIAKRRVRLAHGRFCSGATAKRPCAV